MVGLLLRGLLGSDWSPAGHEVSHFRELRLTPAHLYTWTGHVDQMFAQGQRSVESGSTVRGQHQASPGISKVMECIVSFIKILLEERFRPLQEEWISVWLCCSLPLAWTHLFISDAPVNGGEGLWLLFRVLTFENPYSLSCCAHDQGGETLFPSLSHPVSVGQYSH